MKFVNVSRILSQIHIASLEDTRVVVDTSFDFGRIINVFIQEKTWNPMNSVDCMHFTTSIPDDTGGQ